MLFLIRQATFQFFKFAINFWFLGKKIHFKSSFPDPADQDMFSPLYVDAAYRAKVVFRKLADFQILRFERVLRQFSLS